MMGFLVSLSVVQVVEAIVARYSFQVFWSGEVFVVTVDSNSTVSDFQFVQPLKEIRFSVSGLAGAVGFCNVTIPKSLLGGPWTVQIDGGSLPSSIVVENATHSLLCFTYSHSVHEVEIVGTYVIGPTPIIVPDDFPSIQEAINNANEGDTIFVGNGTYYENVVVNKTVSLIGNGKDSTILNGTTIEPMMIVEANDVRISGFTFEGWTFQGILINGTTGVTIVENKIVFNALGIDVENSANTTIENNIINGFGLDNIGIMVAYSSGCSVVNNTITNAVYDGIRLWFSSGNLIHQNLIKNNDYGIFFHEANLNTISENTISESGGPGIYIESSSTNEILHNSFMDNYDQAMIYDNSVNTWDNGCEGNYWSYYNGTDSNGDGIGDIPFIIDSHNIDYYPLMNPYWIPADINHDLKVDILDVVKATYAYGTDSSDPRWNPHADIAQPYGKIDILDVVLCTGHYAEKYP
jgi:parallel beta-helix repeat protein